MRKCLRQEQSWNGALPTQPSRLVPVPQPIASAHGRRQHVQLVYDAIARQWHGTRYKAWPRVVDFVRDLPPRSLVADLGCGNGKLAPSLRDAGHVAIGCDFSAELVSIAAGEMGMQVRAHRGCEPPASAKAHGTLRLVCQLDEPRPLIARPLPSVPTSPRPRLDGRG